MNRLGDWIQTFTGKQFWPLDVHPDDIVIEDIAHALSMKCRYGGHVDRFYSVAEHSVLVSWSVEPRFKLCALLHDAAEAYLADIPRPIKPLLAGFDTIEADLEKAIAAKFDLVWPWPSEVKAVDTRILHDERKALMGPEPADWNIPGEALGVTIRGWPWDYAERVFLSEFKKLTAPEHTGWAG